MQTNCNTLDTLAVHEKSIGRGKSVEIFIQQAREFLNISNISKG